MTSSYALANISFVSKKSKRMTQVMLPRLALIYQSMSAQVTSSSVFLRRLRAVLSTMASSCGDAFASLKNQQHADDAASTQRHARPEVARVADPNPSSMTLRVHVAQAQEPGNATGDGIPGEDGDNNIPPEKQELQSSIGLVSLSELVEMVILSVRHIDVHADSMQSLHLSGLKAMQLAAARRAQAAEWDRIRRQDCEGLVSASCGELIARTKNGPMAYVSGEAFLERGPARSVFLKHGFFAALQSFESLRQPKNRSSEHTIRSAQVLISRALSKLPESVIDLGHDAVLELLQDDLRYRGSQSRELVTSSFDLVMQTLFIKFSVLLLTPSAGASAGGMSDAFDGGAVLRGAAAGTGGGGGLSGDSSATAKNNILESAEAGVIDTENPVSWVYETEQQASSRSGGKRSRDDGSIEYANDTVDVPSSYGHAATRVLQLLLDEKRHDLFIKFLLECPAVTRYVWNFILTTVCMSSEHAALGVVALTQVAVSRPFLRVEALSALLHLSTGVRLESRRLAVVQVGKLMMSGNVLDTATEDLIVRFAKRFVSRLPLLRSNLASVPAADSDKLLAAWIDRHLSLFLRVCSIPRHCKHLKTIFDVFAECAVSKQLQDGLRQVPDIAKLISALFNAPGQVFELEVMPLLRRHPKGSEALAQKALVVVAKELRNKISLNVATTAGGAAPTALKDTIAIITGHCRAMFSDSAVRLPDNTTIKDARFMTPVLSTVTRADLRQQYLGSLLRLAQLEDASLGSNSLLLVDAFKEVVVPCDIKNWPDDAERSMQLSEVLVFLHTLEGMSNKAFKAALNLLLNMSRTFESGNNAAAAAAAAGGTQQLLYTPSVVLKSVKQLIKIKPIPPQSLYTALIACRIHANQPDLRRAILRDVLEPLAKESIYNEKNDQQLWKGALLLVEDLWGMVDGCYEFLVALPDKVLTKALREHPKLCDSFRQAVGANASYAHIFAAI